MKNNLKAKGKLRLRIYEDDVLIHDKTHDNLVVNQGLENIAQLLAGDAAGKPFARYSAGTDGTAPTLSDTTITGAFQKNIQSVTAVAPGIVEVDFTMEKVENNGMDVAEFGLCDEDDRLLSRLVQTPVTKVNTMRWVGTWTITYTNN